MVRGKARGGISTWAVAMALCLLVLLPATVGAAIPTSPGLKGRAADCTTDAWLTPKSSSVIRYVVWCGTQSGRVTLRVRRRLGPTLLGFSPTARASGPGAAGPLRCRLRRGGR